MKRSLIIPIYNEEKIIGNTLKELNAFLEQEKNHWEILLVDDGSTDNTLKIIKSFKPRCFQIISYKKNKGKGYAIREGVKYSNWNYIYFIDSDLAYSLNHLFFMSEKLKDFDLVIGCRKFDSVKVENISLIRKLFGAGFNFLSRIILNLKFRDMQAWLKGFKKSVAKDLFKMQKINGWSFDVELIYLAKKRGYTIKEIPARVSPTHSYEVSQISLFKDSIKMFFSLIFIKINNLLGKYDEITK